MQNDVISLNISYLVSVVNSNEHRLKKSHMFPFNFLHNVSTSLELESVAEATFLKAYDLSIFLLI